MKHQRQWNYKASELIDFLKLFFFIIIFLLTWNLKTGVNWRLKNLLEKKMKNGVRNKIWGIEHFVKFVREQVSKNQENDGGKQNVIFCLYVFPTGHTTSSMTATFITAYKIIKILS